MLGLTIPSKNILKFYIWYAKTRIKVAVIEKLFGAKYNNNTKGLMQKVHPTSEETLSKRKYIFFKKVSFIFSYIS